MATQLPAAVTAAAGRAAIAPAGTDDAAEYPRQMALVGEPAGERNVDDRAGRARQ